MLIKTWNVENSMILLLSCYSPLPFSKLFMIGRLNVDIQYQYLCSARYRFSKLQFNSTKKQKVYAIPDTPFDRLLFANFSHSKRYSAWTYYNPPQILSLPNLSEQRRLGTTPWVDFVRTKKTWYNTLGRFCPNKEDLVQHLGQILSEQRRLGTTPWVDFVRTKKTWYNTLGRFCPNKEDLVQHLGQILSEQRRLGITPWVDFVRTKKTWYNTLGRFCPNKEDLV